jgi:adhesin transport system membrane fusion protein
MDARKSNLIWVIFFAFSGFIAWTVFFEIDQVVKASGKVISSKRVQVIQSVDGGVLSEMLVKEGSIVTPGQVLARLDKSRFQAASNEVQARVNALKAKVARLRAEVQGTPLVFPRELKSHESVIQVETALYQRRKKSLDDDMSANTKTLSLAKTEKGIVDDLRKHGDVDKLEVFRAEKGVVEAQAKLDLRRNQYYEQASQELVKAEDDLAQNLQILSQRSEVVGSSVLTATVAGTIKNVNVHTIGAVLKPGEELMQVIPLGDDLLIEAKVLPQDISEVKTKMEATIRFDTFDSAIYGTVVGNVTFISGDSIVEKAAKGDETFYLAHVKIPQVPVVTSANKTLDLIPGMNAQIDIKTGRRTIFNFVMKPVTKVFTHSFGEK